MKYIASSKSQMTDINKYYIYTGNEPGMSNGYWYYWDGLKWQIGGEYEHGIDDINETDPNLETMGMSADAKAVKDALSAIRRDITRLDQKAISFNDPNNDGNVVVNNE